MTGLCECGCGNPTTIAHINRSARGWVKGQPKRFILGHGRWKGLGPTARNAYKQVFVAQRDRRGSRDFEAEHVLVAERALGHRLPHKSHVHHVDGNRLNNAPSNLVICENNAYHRLLHFRTRILKAGGNPNTDAMCSTCKQALHKSQFYRATKNQSGVQTRCKACAA